MSLADYTRRRDVRVGGVALVVLLVLSALAVYRYEVQVYELARSTYETLRGIFTAGFLNRALRAASPIALAAVGGLYAEKSGVFNIGLEGFMIFGAIGTGVAMYFFGGGSPGQVHIWLGIGVAVLVCTLLSVLYGVLLIRYKADQIVAGLAVWFLGLGFAPFVAIRIWNTRNYSGSGIEDINWIALPVLSEVPVLGQGLFFQSPLVWLTIAIVVAAWAFLYRTRYGYWIQAAGENPEALDTAGVNVTRVRYGALIFSGAMAGLGGAVLLAHAGAFTGSGDTITNGRGWIGIVAYLFGNYNPIGAALAALLFGGLDMLQIQLQTAGIDVPNRLVNLLPYVGVIVVLTAWGKTRVPAAVGEPYESEE